MKIAHHIKSDEPHHLITTAKFLLTAVVKYFGMTCWNLTTIKAKRLILFGFSSFFTGSHEGDNENMNTVEALQPLMRVFQLLGLSVTRIPTFKYVPLHRFIKYYSLLLVASRPSILGYVLINFKVSANSRLNSFVDRVIIYAGHFLGISIVVEAFVKSRQEEMFLKKIHEIDNNFLRLLNVDLKLNELKKSGVKRLIMWLSAIGTISGWLLYTHYHTRYYRHALIGTLSVFTASLTYFQIITWANLISTRLNIVNQLIKSLEDDYRDDTSSAAIENENGNSSAIDDTFIFDKFRLLCDLCNRLWMQTNILNERFKFSMVLMLANDFIHLVGVLYHMFICLGKNEKCEFFDFDIVVCHLNIFHLTVISRAGQNMANESLQVACAIHRNKFIRCSVKVNSFVCPSSLNYLSFSQKPSKLSMNYLRVFFQIRKFSFHLLHQRIKLNAFGFFDIDYTLIFKVI